MKPQKGVCGSKFIELAAGVSEGRGGNRSK